jgi:hypothetical protein
MERKRRGCGEKLIVRSQSTKRPADWPTFLQNDENKVQFVKVMHQVWATSTSIAKKLKEKEMDVTLICEGTAHHLASGDGITISQHEIFTLKSNQEETDSRVILYAMHAMDEGFRYVRVISPDSDIFFILLHYALKLNEVTLLFDTGTGNNKKLLNVSQIAAGYGQEYCTALMCLHAFTGCDSTSAFVGKGKAKPIKTMQHCPRFCKILAMLGDEWEVPAGLMKETEHFTCSMYGLARLSDVDDVRAHMLTAKCGGEHGRLDPSKHIDFSTLPPCKKSLQQHILRVNYQIGIWKRAHVQFPEIPKPNEGHGWIISASNRMEPQWAANPEDILPQQMVDVLEETLEGSSDMSDDEDIDISDIIRDFEDYSSGSETD